MEALYTKQCPFKNLKWGPDYAKHWIKGGGVGVANAGPHKLNQEPRRVREVRQAVCKREQWGLWQTDLENWRLLLPGSLGSKKRPNVCEVPQIVRCWQVVQKVFWFLVSGTNNIWLKFNKFAWEKGVMWLVLVNCCLKHYLPCFWVFGARTHFHVVWIFGAIFVAPKLRLSMDINWIASTWGWKCYIFLFEEFMASLPFLEVGGLEWFQRSNQSSHRPTTAPSKGHCDSMHRHRSLAGLHMWNWQAPRPWFYVDFMIPALILSPCWSVGIFLM